MTSKRLIEAMNEANTFAAVPSLSATTDRDKLDELNDRLLDLVTYKDKVGTSVNVLYECSRDWTDGIEKLSERERHDELKIQEDFCKDENGDYVVLLDKAQELLDGLKMQEAALIKVIRALQRKVERATAGAPPPSSAATAAAAPPQVNLPLMDLPEFEGDVLKFTEFWDLFEATIDKNSVLGDRQKFSYLKTYLRGRAEKLIEGLSVTEGNYAVAKELLKNTYGKKDYVVQALYRKLEQLKKPQSNAASLRAFMQELEKLCRQLEQLGEDLDQKQILVNLESKMPLSVLSKIAKAKNSGGSWTTKELRELLKRAVELQETIESMSGLEVGSRTQETISHRRRGYRAEFDEEAEPRPSAMFAARRNMGRGPVCVLCEESHFASECKKYASVEERMKRFIQVSRCFRCGRIGHEGRNCRYARPCYFCRSDKHHTCLCRIPRAEEAVLSRQEKPAKVMTVSGNQPPENAPKEDQPERNESPEPVFDLVPEGQWIRTSTVLVAPSKPQVNTLLLTARAKVMNPDDYSHRNVSTLLLDNGAQRTFISMELAHSLRLSEVGREEAAVTTLTTAEPLRVSCPVYEFVMSLDDGRQCRITAYGKDKLIGAYPVMQVEKCAGSEEDNSYWKVTRQVDEPQIILGADYYWQMRIREEAYLPGGMLILQSELGYLAAGKVVDEEKLIGRAVEGQPVGPRSRRPTTPGQLDTECQTEPELTAVQAETKPSQLSVAVAVGLTLLLLAAAIPMVKGDDYDESGTFSWVTASVLMLGIVSLIVLCCCYVKRCLEKRTPVSTDAMPLLVLDDRNNGIRAWKREPVRQSSIKQKRDQGVQAGRGVWTGHTPAERRHSIPVACREDTAYAVGPTVSYGKIRRIKSLPNILDGLLRHGSDAVYGPKNGSKIGDAYVREAGLNSNQMCEPFWPRVSRKAIE